MRANGASGAPANSLSPWHPPQAPEPAKAEPAKADKKSAKEEKAAKEAAKATAG